MVFSLWLQRAMSFWYTKQVGAMHANCFAGCYRRCVGIVQAFDWFFHLLHLFEGDMLY